MRSFWLCFNCHERGARRHERDAVHGGRLPAASGGPGLTSSRVQGKKSEFTPQLDDIKAMARQDMAVARERLAEGRDMVRDYLIKEPIKALGIALCMGVVLKWLIRRP